MENAVFSYVSSSKIIFYFINAYSRGPPSLTYYYARPDDSTFSRWNFLERFQYQLRRSSSLLRRVFRVRNTICIRYIRLRAGGALEFRVNTLHLPIHIVCLNTNIIFERIVLYTRILNRSAGGYRKPRWLL